MDFWKHSSSGPASSLSKATSIFSNTVQEMVPVEKQERVSSQIIENDVGIDFKEIYFLILHFLSSGPCQNTSRILWNELLEHELLPRRYHAWFSRNGEHSGTSGDDGISFPLSYAKLLERYPQIEKDHLVKLLRQLLVYKAPHGRLGGNAPNAYDGQTLLGWGSFALLESDKEREIKKVKPLPTYLRWPHMQADQLHGLSIREIGGGFAKHHRAPSIRSACYAIAKPSTMVQKMQNIKKLRGHRDAVYCAIFDRSGRYVITGSDDRLVKIWSMETAFCLASCRGHEGDITDLAVSSNNALVASASNDFVIRVWRLPDGLPISVLRGHTAAVTAIAFSPRPSTIYQLLSSSDDGTCRIWDARYSQCSPRIYKPKPSNDVTGRSIVQPSNGTSSNNGPQSHQIICCAYNANGTVFVTGSSDTFARVWSASKSNVEESEQPTHEMDVLSGHENDVNYVQFSGCAVPSRSSTSDSLKDENVPKFKNTWFCHDNIVTCSRDGSAIIWIPRSRRSYGKFGRWTRAYHLKVPPPPLPPQPPRGGPRQRLLPTPRGVNMIIWSLDNRFVLAAIMDCRICVWNAVDGSLVHSLTGHTASSYVLDVHPFNPRIAMSAGYDGRTIVWDIWEGTPIRTYEIGRFKLVDGKFSPDGTSIVLSDDVGQIYLLNTGQGDSQKDAKYDQFFLGDYRPLIRDSVGNVLDQETQLAPHRRNIQDPLCDGSMIPYEEPYQTMYQRHRLGALGVEWQPSSLKLATGLDFSLGQDYVMPPLEDLERMMEPVPDFLDAVYWEPEVEVLSDDNDSEYNIAEECSSENERASLCSNSSIEPECSAEDSEIEQSHKDGLRRSRRRKHKSMVRHGKKRRPDENDGSVSGINRTKKAKSVRKSSKSKSSRGKSFRPQRVAARNARNMFSRITGTSTGDDDSDSEYDSSSSDSMLQDSLIESTEVDRNLQNVHPAIVDSEYKAKPTEVHEPQLNGNRKRLVFKFSLRDLKKPLSLEDNQLNEDDRTKVVHPSSGPPELTAAERKVDAGIPQDQDIFDITDGTQANRQQDHWEESADNENQIGWEEIKTCPSKHSSSIVISNHESPGTNPDFDVCNDNKLDVYREKASFESEALQPLDSLRNTEQHQPEDYKSFQFESAAPGDHRQRGNQDGSVCPAEAKGNPRLKLKIKTKGILRDSRSPLKHIVVEDLPSAEGDSVSGNPLCMEQTSEVPEWGDGSGRLNIEQIQNVNLKLKMHESMRERSPTIRADSEHVDGRSEDNDLDAVNYYNIGIDFPGAASDAIRRTRSTRMKVTLREPSAVNHNLKFRLGHESVGTSRSVGSSSFRMLEEEWMPTSNAASRPRSTRIRQGGIYGGMPGHFSGRKSNFPVRKLSWLMLLEHEEGYRYIPQLGDEVVYLRQGHQEFIELNSLREAGPWRSIKGHINAVEICKVENTAYATLPGSGESCCKLTLKFVDPSSSVFDKAFKLTLPELINFPDFIVEKTRYDAAITRNWTHRDKCLVWWRSEDGEGGNWWEGRIVSSQAKSDEFPDSPWERYTIRYKNSENHQHSPWELHDPDFHWDHPQIDHESREELLSSFAKLEKSVTRKQDYYGIEKLNEAAQKLDFLNRFPVPLYPEVILMRIENNYYRSLESVKDDIQVMLTNAKSYFASSAEVSAKIRRLSDFFTKTISRL